MFCPKRPKRCSRRRAIVLRRRGQLAHAFGLARKGQRPSSCLRRSSPPKRFPVAFSEGSGLQSLLMGSGKRESFAWPSQKAPGYKVCSWEAAKGKASHGLPRRLRATNSAHGKRQKGKLRMAFPEGSGLQTLLMGSGKRESFAWPSQKAPGYKSAHGKRQKGKLRMAFPEGSGQQSLLMGNGKRESFAWPSQKAPGYKVCSWEVAKGKASHGLPRRLRATKSAHGKRQKGKLRMAFPEGSGLQSLLMGSGKAFPEGSGLQSLLMGNGKRESFAWPSQKAPGYKVCSWGVAKGKASHGLPRRLWATKSAHGKWQKGKLRMAFPEGSGLQSLLMGSGKRESFAWPSQKAPGYKLCSWEAAKGKASHGLPRRLRATNSAHGKWQKGKLRMAFPEGSGLQSLLMGSGKRESFAWPSQKAPGYKVCSWEAAKGKARAVASRKKLALARTSPNSTDHGSYAPHLEAARSEGDWLI